jgi:hypothetical protein
MQLSFGSGAVWGERTDVTGSGIGPRQFGVLQDIQIDFDWTDKPLYGQLQFPVAIARGQGKITGKAKFAQILGLLYSDIFFGLAPATGQFAVAQLEAASIPAVTPYTVTVANAANYNDDLGVVYAASGKRFNRVTTPSSAGQYSVNFRHGDLHFFIRRRERCGIGLLYLQSDDIGQQAHHHEPGDGDDADVQGDILHQLRRQRDGFASQRLHGRQIVTADQGR